MKVLINPSGELIELDFDTINNLVIRDIELDFEKIENESKLFIVWDNDYHMWSIKEERLSLLNILISDI